MLASLALVKTAPRLWTRQIASPAPQLARARQRRNFWRRLCTAPLMGWAKHDPQGDFVPEWCAIGALFLAGLLLSIPADLHFLLRPGGWCIAAPLVLAAIGMRRVSPRAALGLQFAALVIAADLAVHVATYDAVAMAGPLWDARFMMADRMLGFDWPGYFHFVLDHARLGAVLSFLYFRIGLLALLFAAVMSARGHIARLREMFWLLFIAGLFTAIGGYLFPALGPFKSFGFDSYGYFLPEIEHLRGGGDLTFALGGLQGVIGFPSFHTTLALALIYGFRGEGIVGKTVTILNILLLFGVPVFGGHYLSDMLAGAAVLLLSLTLVKGFAQLRVSVGFASPGYAAASGGAY